MTLETTTSGSAEAPVAGDVLVVFGITGDLAKKMTFRALYRLERRGLLDHPIVGVAFDDWSLDHLRSHAKESIAASGETVDDEVFARFAARLSYVQGDYRDVETYERVAAAVAHHEHPVFYLEIPPSLFATVVSGLFHAGLTSTARVVVEKPFGHDLASAVALNADLRRHLAESQIFRIDHFLGKEPSADILALRFANSVFEPLWNRDHIDAVQITMAEDFGVSDRGSFYDPVGALRDVVQNHLLQVLALVAMEPPGTRGADALQDRRVDVFESMPEADPAECIRGQYDGYLDVAGVAPTSSTETFVALRLNVDNWRWSGVPFFIRAGKAMTTSVTEVRVRFKRPPRIGFAPHLNPDADQFVIRFSPQPGAALLVQVKDPQGLSTRPVDLSLVFAEELGEAFEPYERLLHQAMLGNSALFSREDLVEQTWRVVQPLIDQPPPVLPYGRGSMGPDAADELVRGWPAWVDPWLPRP